MYFFKKTLCLTKQKDILSNTKIYNTELLIIWIKNIRIFVLSINIELTTIYNCETHLPAVELEYFDAAQNLVHHLDATILDLKLLRLQLLSPIGHQQVHRDKHAHRAHSDQRRHTQILPQHVNGDCHLQRRRPQHIQVGGQVGTGLRVHGHQVRHLADGGLLSRGRGKRETLLVDDVHDGSAHAGAHDEHAVEVVLQDKGLDERADEEQAGEEETDGQILILVFDEVDELVEDDGPDKLKDVVD